MKLVIEFEKEHLLDVKIVKRLESLCKSELSSLSKEGKENLSWNIKALFSSLDDMKTNSMLLIKRNVSEQVDKVDIDSCFKGL